MLGYSDWEYYSDDYWDEDPSTLKPKGSLSTTNEVPQKQGGTRAQKKRKAAAEIDLSRKRVKPSRSDDRPDQVFYGPLWRKELESTDQNSEYKPGQQERVALLKDWRTIFRDSQPRSDRWREERARTTSKRRAQVMSEGETDVEGDRQDLDETRSEAKTARTARGKGRASKGGQKAEQGDTSKNQQTIDNKADLELEPKPPPRRRKIEIEETKKVQNGVITQSTLTTAVQGRPAVKSKKRSRADEGDAPPPNKSTRTTRRNRT